MHISKYPRKYSSRPEGERRVPVIGGLVFMLIMGVIATPAIIEEMDQKRGRRAEKHAYLENKPKIEARATIFTDYVFDDVKTYVLHNMPSQRKIDTEAAYYDSDYQERHIQYLVQDSTKYANAIIRDVPFVVENICNHYTTVNKYEPLYMIAHLDDVDSKTLCETAMNYVNKSEKYLPTRSWTQRLDGWQEVRTENPAYKMKINIGHLKEICKDLAYARAVKAQAVRNTNGRGK